MKEINPAEQGNLLNSQARCLLASLKLPVTKDGKPSTMSKSQTKDVQVRARKHATAQGDGAAVNVNHVGRQAGTS